MNSSKKPNLIGGSILLILCAYWFWQVAIIPHTVFDPPWVFLDFANLIFHEAGHIIFLFLGDFLHVLGGSLMQLLVPGITLGAFLYQEDYFSAGFSLFWLGESAMNLSYYISDARTQALPLLGGDPSGHDWTWLLNDLHLINSDTALGGVVHFLAILIMLGGISWMVWTLYTSRKYATI